MISEAKTAVRNAGLLMAQKGSHILTGTLFAVAVPRLMGSETFGKYALLTSISIWFALVSSVSSAQTMGRFVPQFVLQKDGEGLRKFVGNFLCLRLLNGSTAAACYLLVTLFWFRELDFWAVLFVAGAIVFRTVSKLIFALFLGLNNASRWAIGETLNRWTSLIFIIPGFYFGGLAGACLAMMLTEMAILAIGTFWAKDYLLLSKIRWDRKYFSPFLSFSLAFFVSNVLLSLSQHSGELLIRFVSGDYVQVGLFGAAYRSYYTVTIAIWQFTMAFSPLFTTLRTQNEPQELRRWAEFLLKWTAVGGVILVFLILLLGENLVPFVFGKSYLQAAANLLPLMVALLVYALGCVARVLALTYDRPGITLQATLLHLAVFWGVGIPLVAWRGSFAGCLAVLFATTIYAAFFTWRIRGAIGYSLRGWLMAILSGTLFLPLAWLRSSWRVNLALFASFLIVYAAVLLVLRIVTPDEIARVRLALKPRVLTRKSKQAQFYRKQSG